MELKAALRTAAEHASQDIQAVRKGELFMKLVIVDYVHEIVFFAECAMGGENWTRPFGLRFKEIEGIWNCDTQEQYYEGP